MECLTSKYAAMKLLSFYNLRRSTGRIAVHLTEYEVGNTQTDAYG